MPPVPPVRPSPPFTTRSTNQATELAFFGATVLHPLSMQPAAEYTDGEMGVRVKNSYNRTAAGTLISKTRDMKDGEDLVTSIVLKRNVTLVDIVSTRMLGQIGFLAKVFEIFNTEGLSVDVVATSEVSVSLTLDPAKTLWERDLIDEELESLMAAFSVGIQHSPTRALTHSLTDSLVRSLARCPIAPSPSHPRAWPRRAMHAATPSSRSSATSTSRAKSWSASSACSDGSA